MQAPFFTLRTLAATSGLSLLSLLGLAQSMPQSGLARPSTGAPLPAAAGQTTTVPTQPATGQGKVGSPVPTTTSPLGQPGPALGSPAGVAPGTPAIGAGAAAGAAGTSFGQYPVAVGMPAGGTANTLPADTVRLTLDEAQGRFVQANFQLLAQHYNVDVANAAIRQALLRDNPNLQLEVNAYNPNTQKLFPFGRQTDVNNPTGGTVVAQVQQLIDISGRRSRLVQLSRTAVGVQQAAFEDLLRQARYQLTQSFYNVIAERRKLGFVNQERTQLGRLLDSYRERLRLGVVASYEVTRLELEQQTLNATRSDLLNQLTQDEAQLRVFLAAPGTVFVSPIDTDLLAPAPATVPALADLTTQAYALRPDLRAATQQTTYAQQNLAVQHSLAVPKLMVGADYASYGNSYPNYFGLQSAIDLPVLNRNQGNIQAAKVGILQSNAVVNQARLQVEQDVAAAYEQLQRASALRQAITPDYLGRIANVGHDAVTDYNRRLIDIVSFIDKFRAYKDAQLNLIDLSNRLRQAEQQVNFATNAKVF